MSTNIEIAPGGGTEYRIERPYHQEEDREVALVEVRAEQITVTSQQEHEQAQQFLAYVAGMQKNVEKLFAGSKKAAHLVHAEICSAERKLLQPLKDARTVVSRKLDVYEEEQRRLIAEETRRQQEALRKQQEEEQLLDAIAAEEAGDKVAAEEILNEEPPEVVVSVKPKLAEVKGVSGRKIWDAQVTDLVELIRYVAANPQWKSLLTPNQTALRQLAKAQKADLSIPGVKAYFKTSRAVSSS